MNRTFRVSSFFCLTMFHQAAVPSQLAINDPTMRINLYLWHHLRLKQAHLEVRCSGKIGKLGFRDQKITILNVKSMVFYSMLHVGYFVWVYWLAHGGSVLFLLSSPVAVRQVWLFVTEEHISVGLLLILPFCYVGQPKKGESMGKQKMLLVWPRKCEIPDVVYISCWSQIDEVSVSLCSPAWSQKLNSLDQA